MLRREVAKGGEGRRGLINRPEALLPCQGLEISKHANVRLHAAAQRTKVVASFE